MRRVVVIVILCLLFCAIYAQDTTHKDWAKFGRYEQANLDLKKAPRAIFYGNSITDFWVNNHSVFFADNQFVDRGVSGQTTSEMLVRFRQDVINLKPKAVVIMAGINDIAHNMSLTLGKLIYRDGLALRFGVPFIVLLTEPMFLLELSQQHLLLVSQS